MRHQSKIVPKSRVFFPPPPQPVKVHQRPEDPVNTRQVNRKGKHLLRTARKKLLRFGRNTNIYRKDCKDVFTYVYPKFLLVAKQYIWKGTISIHFKAIAEAYNTNRNIVIYIGDLDSFYELDPVEILRYYHENEDIVKENIRGRDVTQLMLNFPFDEVGHTLVFQDQPTLETFDNVKKTQVTLS